MPHCFADTFVVPHFPQPTVPQQGEQVLVRAVGAEADVVVVASVDVPHSMTCTNATVPAGVLVLVLVGGVGC